MILIHSRTRGASSAKSGRAMRGQVSVTNCVRSYDA